MGERVFPSEIQLALFACLTFVVVDVLQITQGYQGIPTLNVLQNLPLQAKGVEFFS